MNELYYIMSKQRIQTMKLRRPVRMVETDHDGFHVSG